MGNIHIIPNLQQIEKTMRLVEQYGVQFEYNDFFNPEILINNKKIAEIINHYKSLGRDCSSDMLHGAFYDVTVVSQDPDIKRISQDRINRSMDAAQRLGVKGVIIHTNYIVGFNNDFYVNGWIDGNAEYFCSVLEKYPELNIYMENMWDDNPFILKKLYDKIHNPRFGICFDVAHANLHPLSMDNWFEELGEGIRHIHINDNDGICDSHEVVGSMSVNWRQYDKCIRIHSLDASVLIEMNDLNKAEASLLFLRSNGYAPYNK